MNNSQVAQNSNSSTCSSQTAEMETPLGNHFVFPPISELECLVTGQKKLQVQNYSHLGMNDNAFRILVGLLKKQQMPLSVELNFGFNNLTNESISSLIELQTHFLNSPSETSSPSNVQSSKEDQFSTTTAQKTSEKRQDVVIKLDANLFNKKDIQTADKEFYERMEIFNHFPVKVNDKIIVVKNSDLFSKTSHQDLDVSRTDENNSIPPSQLEQQIDRICAKIDKHIGFSSKNAQFQNSELQINEELLQTLEKILSSYEAAMPSSTINESKTLQISDSQHDNFIKKCSTDLEEGVARLLLSKDFSGYVSKGKLIKDDDKCLETDIILQSPDKASVVLGMMKTDTRNLRKTIKKLQKRRIVLRYENISFLNSQKLKHEEATIRNPELTAIVHDGVPQALKIYLVMGAEFFTEHEKKMCESEGIIVVASNSQKKLTGISK